MLRLSPGALGAAIDRNPLPYGVALLLAALAVRLVRLDAPPIPVFDEGLFYIPAARAYLAGLPDPNPEHPPLGKLAFAAGMALFGDTPWGWRAMSAAAGVAGIGGTCLLGAWLWRSAAAGLLAGALLSLDLLWFLFSRLMMYDIFLGALVTAGLAFAWRHRQTGGSGALAAAGVAIGLAAAVKWAGLWALGPTALALAGAPGAGQRATLIRRLTLLAAGTAAGYLAPWLYHGLVLGYGPSQIAEQHLAMLNYHVALRAPADPVAQLVTPLRWLLNEPLVFTSREDRSVWVAALSNPLLFWGGIAALAWCGWRVVRSPHRRAALGGPHAFLLAWGLAFYLPWFAFPRIKYFYYLLPLLPALALALTGGLAALLQPAGPRLAARRLVATGFGVALVALAVGLYPAVTGMLGAPR